MVSKLCTAMGPMRAKLAQQQWGPCLAQQLLLIRVNCVRRKKGSLMRMELPLMVVVVVRYKPLQEQVTGRLSYCWCVAVIVGPLYAQTVCLHCTYSMPVASADANGSKDVLIPGRKAEHKSKFE